jgi:GNAT superfamily N-acetyltransferase
MSTQRQWSIRAYRDGDEREIFELWKLTLLRGEENLEKWLKWWNWRYKENPAGSGIIWLAEHSGKIVGQYALIPVRMKIGAETILTAHSLDTMTHPAYAHQGIFTTLANKAYEDAAKRGIKIVHGFPNRYSHPGFINNLDWADVVTRQILIKPFQWRNAIRLKVNNKFLSAFLALSAASVFNKFVVRTQKAPNIENMEIREVTSFDDRIDTLWDKISPKYQIISVRDRDYLNWRYVSTPDVPYSIYVAEKDKEICGYLVSRIKQWDTTRLGVIFDILAESVEVAHCLLSMVGARFESDQVDTAFCRMIENKILSPALKRSGFLTVPAIKEVPLGVRSNESGIPQDFLKDPQNWFIQIGDSDWM